MPITAIPAASCIIRRRLNVTTTPIKPRSATRQVLHFREKHVLPGIRHTLDNAALRHKLGKGQDVLRRHLEGRAWTLYARSRVVDADLVLRVIKIDFRTLGWIFLDHLMCFSESIDEGLIGFRIFLAETLGGIGYHVACRRADDFVL